MPSRHYLEETYRFLHRHPELAFEETKTSEFVARELGRFGFSVRRGIGGTGVAAFLDLAGPGLCLALRSDLDGLPVQEETGVSYASENPGVMHACGHDSHIAMVLACCAWVSENKGRLKGTLFVIFQPAEEIVAGALAMLKDGVFAEKLPERLVGVHNWPDLPVGSIGLQSGPVTAFSDRFRVVFQGQGGHGGFPHKTKDPIAMASAGIQGAFSWLQRRSEAVFPQTISFGTIQGGRAFNIIPDQVCLEGTARTVRAEDQARLINGLQQAFTSAASLYGGSCQFDYEKGVPAVVNDPKTVEELTEIIKSNYPEIPLVEQGLASLIGEDLAYFLEKVPGALLLVGSGKEGALNELHSSRFLVHPETLQVGSKVLTAIVQGYLGTGS